MESWGFTFDQSLSSAVAFGRDQVGLIGWELKPQLCSIPNELNFDNQIFGDTNFPPLAVQDHESKSRESGLIDLKLGRILDQKDNKISHSLSTSKGLGFCSSTPFCKVYGCNKNLSKCKEYYKRHKVCELHSKTSKVVVNGIEQRFCQQCSRFHLLREFDNGKRSCRKRLAGHNERRRKPHVGPLFDRHLPSYNISVQGNEFHETAVAISSFANCNDLPSPHQPMHKTNARWDMNLEGKSAQNVQSTSNITGEQFHSISVSPCNFETSPRVINECTRGSISSPESARSLLSSQSGKTSTHSYIGQPVLLGSHDFDNIVGFPDNMVELEVMHHDEKVLRDESCMIDLVRLSRLLDRVEHRKRKAQVNHAN